MKRNMTKILIAVVLMLTLTMGLANPQYADTNNNEIAKLVERITQLESENAKLSAQLKLLESNKAIFQYNSKALESDYIDSNQKRYVNVEILSGLLGKKVTLDDSTKIFTVADKAEAPAIKTPASEKKEITVYVTKTGSKYHNGGCRYLRKSKIPMDLSEAKKYYSPCSVCNPPK